MPLSDEPTFLEVEKKTIDILSDNEPIVLSEHAFSELLVGISGEPDKPSEKLLAAVTVYKKHEPVALTGL